MLVARRVDPQLQVPELDFSDRGQAYVIAQCDELFTIRQDGSVDDSEFYCSRIWRRAELESLLTLFFRMGARQAFIRGRPTPRTLDGADWHGPPTNADTGCRYYTDGEEFLILLERTSVEHDLQHAEFWEWGDYALGSYCGDAAAIVASYQTVHTFHRLLDADQFECVELFGNGQLGAHVLYLPDSAEPLVSSADGLLQVFDGFAVPDIDFAHGHGNIEELFAGK